MAATILAVGLALLLLEFLTHRRLARALAPAPSHAVLARHPSVTVIRPVRGLDPGAAENMRAGLDHDYPGPVETLFVFDDEAEPAVPIARAALEEQRRAGRPGSAEILFCGSPPAGRTGKLNAMIHGLARARGEIIVFADSDIRSARAALRTLVEALFAAPRTGSAFAPVVVSEPARTLGDAVYAVLLNGLYTPPASACARRHAGELPFILGQFMAITRECLAEIGGLESVQGQLVDDLYIGQLVRAAGLRNVVSTHPVSIIQYGLAAPQVVDVTQRWFAFSRTGIPEWSFKLPIALRAVSFWLGALGACAGAAAGHAAAALPCALVAACVTASVGRLHQQVGGAPLRGVHRLAPVLIYAIAPWMLLRVRLLRAVHWRGRAYALDASGRLARPARAGLPRQAAPHGRGARRGAERAESTG